MRDGQVSVSLDFFAVLLGLHCRSHRWLGCSYDYEHALSEILPTVAAKKLAKGGFLVLRPDSGDPVQTVVLGLRAAEKVFGCDINSKGFKVPRGCSVIQGVLHRTVCVILSGT